MVRVVLLWNQSNTFGLSQDAKLLEVMLTAFGNSESVTYEITYSDPLQPPTNADIVVHLEIPHPVWLPWAPVQIWMVNPEWCSPNWLPYAEQFTQVWLKEQSRVAEFGSKAKFVPWASRGPLKTIYPESLGKRSALWVLGASQNKHIAARALLPLWPADFPLTVTTTLEPSDLSGSFPDSVTVRRGFLEADELEDLNQRSAIHVAISAAEGFGFTAAQAECRGAAVLLNTLPVYEETYRGCEYVSFLSTPVSRGSKDHLGYMADFSAVTTQDLVNALQVIPSGQKQVEKSDDRYRAMTETVRHLLKSTKRPGLVQKSVQPPLLHPKDAPAISVLTVTYKRRNFIDLAFINMLTTDYPMSKIQWVIVDDSPATDSVLDKVKAFEARQPGCDITFIPMSTKRSIGYKRNKAVQAARHSICVNMDDDDVYPETSFRRRVAWLLSDTKKQVVGCTMIAMYDLQMGISAVNTPPWSLRQSERVSEASLCFYKDFAVSNPFPDVQTSEGEGFVDACQGSTFLEIPPQQILVALNHGTNTSSRVIAGRAQTGCFWNWDTSFIKWLHGLVGVAVEEVE
jgi:hypothetical protein